MCSPDRISLHTVQFMGIQLIFAPHLRRYIIRHFKSCGFQTGRAASYPLEDTDSLVFIFDPAKQTKVLARVIMGLFKRKSIEVDMHCIARSHFDTHISKFTLHSTSDVHLCERLLGRCSVINVHYQSRKGHKVKLSHSSEARTVLR